LFLPADSFESPAAALQEDEHNQCSDEQDGDLHGWTHEHSATAVSGSVFTTTGIGISSTHDNSLKIRMIGWCFQGC
jgi:hypothetical protein